MYFDSLIYLKYEVYIIDEYFDKMIQRMQYYRRDTLCTEVRSTSQIHIFIRALLNHM